MSGPKVVSIVTREEIEAICRRYVYEMEAALDRLKRLATRLGRLDDHLASEIKRQRQELSRLFDDERWVELQRRGPVMVANVEAHADRLRSDVILAAAAERTKGRRLADAARSLIGALEASSRIVHPELHDVAKNAAGADPAQLSRFESVMSRALADWQRQNAEPAAEATAAQRALAQRLGIGEQGKTLDQWIDEVSPPDKNNLRLDALLAEIGTFVDRAAAEQFSLRARSIGEEPDQNRRALLTDYLILDVARCARECRAGEAALQRLQKARAALATLKSEQAIKLAERLETALQSGKAVEADTLCCEAEALAHQEIQEIAARARRRAVLSGLAALGYEVRESMTTAWAENGRLILRKPSSPDYGLELGAPADAARLQLRVVGAANPCNPRNEERDRDQEVTWCGDFDKLRVSLAAAGDSLILERALEAGEQPLKNIILDGRPTEHTQVERGLRSRTLS